jgi:hypothetical protein
MWNVFLPATVCDVYANKLTTINELWTTKLGIYSTTYFLCRLPRQPRARPHSCGFLILMALFHVCPSLECGSVIGISVRL